MSVDWQDILTAFALLLVLEGLGPFLSPSGWRRIVEMLSRLTDAELRVIGLGVTITGVILLSAIRHA